MDQFFTVSAYEASGLIIALIAFLVSILTMYNAAKLKTGIIAASTVSFGIGMLCLSAGFFLLALPPWIGSDPILYRVLFAVGFIFLGWGSYKIFKMAQIS